MYCPVRPSSRAGIAVQVFREPHHAFREEDLASPASPGASCRSFAMQALVVKPAEGASLARTLGQNTMVLMRRHGVTIVGEGVQDCVYKAVQTCRNAEFLVRALAIGPAASLSPGETRRCNEIPRTTTAIARSWDYWAMQVGKVAPLGRGKAPAKPRRGRKLRRR